MSTRKLIYGLIAAAALLGAGAGGLVVMSDGASAGQSGILDDGKSLLPKAGITLADAIAAAQTAATGAVDEVDLEYWDGKLVFNVDVGSSDVKVDAATGAVLAVARDD